MAAKPHFLSLLTICLFMFPFDDPSTPALPCNHQCHELEQVRFRASHVSSHLSLPSVIPIPIPLPPDPTNPLIPVC